MSCLPVISDISRRPAYAKFTLPILALALATWGIWPAEPARPPIESVLPKHFGFGVSCFGAGGDWPERMKRERGVAWDYLYVYAVLVDDIKARNAYLEHFLRRAEKAHAIPIVSFYQLLDRGRRKGLKGSEIEVVVAAIKDKDLMRAYLADVKEVLQVLAKSDHPAIFHSEPDSWAFMEWHGSNDTHDARQCPAMVKSCGLPEAAGFEDNAAGLAQAILHLRDLYAPRVYMGFHAKDCRVGTQPEKTVKFIRDCGKWDILIGDGIGHVYLKRDGNWWDTINDERMKLYMTWFGTLTRELGLKYIHWQSVVGASDYALMPDYPARERISNYISAGSAGCAFDLRGDPEKGARSDSAHGYNERPPDGHPAMNTPQALIERLERYYKNPLPIPDLAARAGSTAAALPAAPAVPLAAAMPGSAAPPPPRIDERALALWRGKLIERLSASLKAGAKVYVFARLFGPGAEEKYLAASVSENALSVKVQGSVMPIPWKVFSARAIANVARSLATEDDAESLLLAAVFLFASDRPDEAEDFFAKAAAKDSARVREVKASLTPEISRPPAPSP